MNSKLKGGNLVSICDFYRDECYAQTLAGAVALLYVWASNTCYFNGFR